MVATIWGVAFVVGKVGVESFTPPQLTALRVMTGAAAVFLLPRPAIPRTSLIFIGLTMFKGQFSSCSDCFRDAGWPDAVAIRTQPSTPPCSPRCHRRSSNTQTSRRHSIALLGLLLIGLTLGAGATVIGFMLQWLGRKLRNCNVLVKRLPKVDMLRLVVWASLVPPLPALAISMAMDAPLDLITALGEASWLGLAAPLYLGLIASVLAYAVWGHLLQQYSTGAVAPFALLAPVVAAATSALVLGEEFTGARLAE